MVIQFYVSNNEVDLLSKAVIIRINFDDFFFKSLWEKRDFQNNEFFYVEFYKMEAENISNLQTYFYQ